MSRPIPVTVFRNVYRYAGYAHARAPGGRLLISYTTHTSGRRKVWLRPYAYSVQPELASAIEALPRYVQPRCPAVTFDEAVKIDRPGDCGDNDAYRAYYAKLDELANCPKCGTRHKLTYDTDRVVFRTRENAYGSWKECVTEFATGRRVKTLPLRPAEEVKS